jgi:hypothetical protein
VEHHLLDTRLTAPAHKPHTARHDTRHTLSWLQTSEGCAGGRVPTETHQENARLSGLVFAVRGDALRDLGAVAARMGKTKNGECTRMR